MKKEDTINTLREINEGLIPMVLFKVNLKIDYDMSEIRNLTRNGETFYPLTHEKAVIGMDDFKETITEQIDNYRPIEITGDVTNAPDEEDITSDSNNLLKFKNRNNLYGLGKVILRRGSSFASQVTLANTIYVIQYNFDLDNGRVNIPNGSILLFEGGTISNGTLVCADLYDVRLVYYQDQSEILSSVTLEGNFIHKACDKDTIREILVDNSSITKDVNDVLSVKANGIQNTHLNSNVVDNSSISLDSNNKISIKDGGVTGSKLNSGIVNTDDLSIVSNKIQFANRGTTNGMGKIILRKDQSFASQLTQQNTIYVIQYDFDLGSTQANPVTVTIPANCILEFDGGSLRNGTLDGVDFDIDANHKCLDSISFGTNAVKFIKCRVAWFVTKYPLSSSDTTVDNTQEIMQALDSGARYIVFPSYKYLRITSTLSYIGDAEFHTESDGTSTFNGAADTQVRPCIFTDSVITMLDYKYNSAGYKQNIYLGDIDFLCKTPFSDLSGINIPVLRISTHGTSIWGGEIKCNIVGYQRELFLKGTTAYFFSYTGIEIDAADKHITMLNIRGSVYTIYRAYNFVKTSENPADFFTDVAIWGSTKCAIGGNNLLGNPIRIYGTHQPVEMFSQEEFAVYFSSSWINMYGFVWDMNHTNSTTGLHTVNLAYEVTGNDTRQSNFVIRTFPIGSAYKFAKDIYHPLFLSANGLRSAYINNFNGVKDVTIEVNGVSIKNTPNLIQCHNLFSRDFNLHTNSPATYSYKENCYINLSESSTIVITFIVDAVVMGISRDENGCFYFRPSRGPANLKIYTSDNVDSFTEQILSFDYSEEDSYNSRVGIIGLNDFERKRYLKFVITCNPTETSGRYPMPFMYLPSRVQHQREVINTALWGWPVFEAGAGYGYTFYNISFEREFIYKGGGSWKSIQTSTIPGTKPLYPDAQKDLGYQYFDNSLGYPTFFVSGSKWVDAFGFTAYLHKGSSLDRPTPSANDSGVTYYDTSLGKMILWNGSAWVNMDGSALL